MHHEAVLDGARVPKITAFLFTRGGNEDPAPLKANANISYNGCAIAGLGFLFDDEDPKSNSISTMKSLISENVFNYQRILPYVGGNEINNNPDHAHRKYAIFFGGMPLQDAEKWPDLLDILRQKVKPERDRANRPAHREKWWQFGDWRPGLFLATAGLRRMLCVVFISQHLGFVWMPVNIIVSHNVGVFAAETDEFFCVVQSRVHEIFATQLSSGLEDRQGYRPSDGFEPFPFPSEYHENSSLAMLGKEYYGFRSEMMVRNDEGLTKMYNRFHDPDELHADILKLRELHSAMDQAVLNSYGWNDIDTNCEFLLDYEIDDDEANNRKKPWRYRWPDEVRDEVLARLILLNAQRAAEERRAGLALPAGAGDADDVETEDPT